MSGIRRISLCVVMVCSMLGWTFYWLTSDHAPKTAVQPFSSESEHTRASPSGYHRNISNVRSMWIVVDALTSSCEDVTTLTSQGNWTVLIVVVDYIKVTGCQPHNCRQLTWRECQTELSHLATISALGVPSTLLGYLLAIEKGADVILDADCHTDVENISSRFLASELNQSGLFYDGSKLFNPFHHWGYKNAYPLQFFNLTNQQLLESLSNDAIYHLIDITDLFIRQGVMLSKNTCHLSTKNKQWADNLISQGSPVIIGPKSLAPLNTGPTLFYKNSFMWMFLPPDVNTAVTQFFRTLWLHQLSKLSLVTLSYFDLTSGTSHDLKYRNEVCAPFNMSSSKPVFYNYWQCLPDLKCPSGVDFIDCSFALAQQVATCLVNDKPSLKDEMSITEIILAWKSDLVKLGALPRLDLSSQKKNIFKIRYGVPLLNSNLASQQLVNESVMGSFSSLCSQSNSSFVQYLKHWSNPKITDILLVIVINYESLFETLPYMEFIHRQYFKHIVYCGPSLDEFVKYADSLGLTYVTYIEGMTHSWLFMYECITHAMKLRLPVRGYLQIGEDVLLNSWNLNRLPRDHFWFPKRFTKLHLYERKPNYPWVHWNHPFGQEAIVNVFSELKNASTLPLSDQTNKKLYHFAKRFLENYSSNFDSNFILYGWTDIFYIPDILRDDYILASELFRKHKVMTEIAVPVLHLGLVKNESLTYIKGHGLWHEEREIPWTFFNATESIFIHPFKLLSHAKTNAGNGFYCKIFMDVYESFL